jgi:parallel beta-helix repeat protein
MNEETNLKACVLMLIFLLGMACTAASARTIYVDDDGPADFNTIQAAIDDSNDGDTIIVSDGTYTGNGNRDIDFLGKAVTLRSEYGPQNCIIDCQGSEADKHRGFYFHSGEDANSVLDGFTIRNGYKGYGGGILCTESSPHITNCVITNNTAPLSSGFPGGFYTPGGGISCNYSSTTISNCIISGNQATGSGGGIRSYKGSPTINNCTISDNSALNGDGGGIHCIGAIMTVRNSILWGNTAGQGPQIYLVGVPGVFCPIITISYSDVQGGQGEIYIWDCGNVNWGSGNIDVAPCFVDSGDYHLKSQAGRWEPSSQAWVQDEVTSLCIDAGNTNSPIGFEPFPNGGIINMGAYGSTSEASKSYFGGPVCEIIVAGDVNGDCKVNFLDFRLMALNWLRDEHEIIYLL